MMPSFHVLKNKWLIIGILFLTTLSNLSAKTYYAAKKTGLALWDNSSSWVTDNCTSTTNSGTFPGTGDTAIICGGNKIQVENFVTCAQLNILDGSLIYSDAFVSSLYVQGGDLVLKKAGLIEYSGNKSLKHNLFIDGDLLNEGQLDLRNDGDDYVLLSFTGSTNSKVMQLGGSYELGYMSMNKNKSDFLVDIQDTAFSKALTEGSVLVNHSSLDLNRGVFRHSASEKLSNVYQAGQTVNDPYVISPKVSFQVYHGQVSIISNNTTYLEGSIIVNGGILNISTGLLKNDTTSHGLFYRGTKAVILVQNKGVLSIPGAFKNSESTSVVNFAINDGIVDVAIVKPTVETFKITRDSQFSPMNGKITINQSSTFTHSSVEEMADYNVATTLDYGLVPDIELIFGNERNAIPNEFRFKPYPSYLRSLPHVVVEKLSTLRPYSSTFDNNIFLLSLTIKSNATFDTRDFKTGSDHNHLHVMLANDRGYGFYNLGKFEARQSWIVFHGAFPINSSLTAFRRATQRIGGYVALGTPTNTIFSSLEVSTLFNKSVSQHVILEIPVLVQDTVLLSRNLNLNKQELKIGVSDKRSGFMYAEPNTGVYDGKLTRYVRSEIQPLFFQDFEKESLASYMGKITDVPFYFVSIDTFNTVNIGRIRVPTKSLDHTDCTLRIGITQRPQKGGYISVVYSEELTEILDGDIHKTYGTYPLNVTLKEIFATGGSDDITGASVFNWTISAEPGLDGGTYSLALRNSSIAVPKYGFINTYVVLKDRLVGEVDWGKFARGPIYPYIANENKPDQIWYYGKFYAARKGLSFADLNQRFHLGFSDVYKKAFDPPCGLCGFGTLIIPHYVTVSRQNLLLSPKFLTASGTSSSHMLKKEGESELTISPNPSMGDDVKISIPAIASRSTTTYYRIIDIYGNTLSENYIYPEYDKTENKHTEIINVSSLKKGIYTLFVLSGDKTYLKQLIIN